MHSKTGVALSAVGESPRFAESCGLSIDRYRTIGSVVSQALGAVGIIVYAQTFGFCNFTWPLFSWPFCCGIHTNRRSNLESSGHLACHGRLFLSSRSWLFLCPLLTCHIENLAEVARIIITTDHPLCIDTPGIGGGA